MYLYKTINLKSAITLMFLCACISEALAQKSPRDRIDFPPLNEIKMPTIHQTELKNGMKLFLIEDPVYPTVDLRALVRTGGIYEPEDKIGLANITGAVLRTGGTAKMTGDEMDKLLETLGASVESWIDEESGTVNLSLLSEDIDLGINIMADILTNPAFREEKVNLQKIMERSMISRRNDNVWWITGREFAALIYGKDSPFARYPEYSTIDVITREDIVEFYEKYFKPNNVILAAWGDFNSIKLQEKLEKAFANWEVAQVTLPEVPEVNYEYKYTVNYIEKSDINQTHIQMGHIGGQLNNPDYPALLVMNQILSYDRMFKVLRTQEGLTYAPWGNYSCEFDHPGIFTCGTQTKSSTTVYAIRLMLKEVERMTREEVTEEELHRAKDTYLNGFVFNFDSKAKIVNRMLNYAYHDYPLDFIEQTKQNVEKVTREDILRVAKKYLHPDKMQILVVGNHLEFDEPLTVLGKVNTIDITIPQSSL